MEKIFDEKSYKGKKIAIFDADITKHTMASVGEKRTIEVILGD